MSELIIEKEADGVMRRDAIAKFPDECCGFFYGEEKEGFRIVRLAVPVENAQEGDQKRRFEISPFDYMKAESFALQNNFTLLGIYHSHPQHPAIASEHDLKFAMPYFSYVIYSVIDGKINDIKSWILDDNNEKFIEQKLQTIILETIKQ
jgi:proteasome lid subunit RPN8/RPN11